MKVGIDVGGTFTDFLVLDEDGTAQVAKVLSTPQDPSIGLLEGLALIARERGMSLEEFAGTITTIVHGTTVTTNVTLTGTGARNGLLTTAGVRDALEVRRGIREEQYNNRYTNVPPLVPRYLRRPVRGRLDHAGVEVEPLCVEDIEAAVDLMKDEGVEAVAICFMNSFANPEHEQRASRGEHLDYRPRFPAWNSLEFLRVQHQGVTGLSPVGPATSSSRFSRRPRPRDT